MKLSQVIWSALLILSLTINCIQAFELYWFYRVNKLRLERGHEEGIEKYIAYRYGSFDYFMDFGILEVSSCEKDRP